MDEYNPKKTELAEKIGETLGKKETAGSRVGKVKGRKVRQKKEKSESHIQAGEEKYYTASELAEKTGVKKPRIIYLAKQGYIKAIKGEGKRSPYQIPETELPKLQDKSLLKTRKKKEKRVSVPRVAKKETQPFAGKSSKESIELQKILAETMNRLAATQEQLASMLAHLI